MGIELIISSFAAKPVMIEQYELQAFEFFLVCLKGGQTLTLRFILSSQQLIEQHFIMLLQ